MSSTRLAFDPGLPVVVASQDFVYGGKPYANGASFPWRDLGISENDVWMLWRSFKVDCVALSSAEPKKPRGKRQPASPATE